VLFQHAGQFVHFGRRIIDDQNTCHGLPHSCRHRARWPSVTVVSYCGKTAAKPGTWAWIAFSSSSLLKGLVKNWSEPTMRPLALSNSQSLDDSMMTGVDLNALLFLIKAKV